MRKVNILNNLLYAAFFVPFLMIATQTEIDKSQHGYTEADRAGIEAIIAGEPVRPQPDTSAQWPDNLPLRADDTDQIMLAIGQQLVEGAR